MNGPLNGPGVRDAILKQGKTATESTAYFWANITKGVQDSSKGVLTVYSGRRAGVGTFKAGKDFARGDIMCGSLCCFSISNGNSNQRTVAFKSRSASNIIRSALD